MVSSPAESEVAADGGDEAGGVHGAAGAGVPGPAGVAAVAVEGVGVEVVLAVAGEAAEGVVEERLLQHVGVAAVEVEVEHALGPEDQRDGGAGLGVGGGVGEVVGLGEALVGGGGAEAGGDVDLRGHDVLPEGLAGAFQAVVAELGGEVGHGGVHVHGADGVADDAVLLADRAVGLVVLVALGPEVLRVLAAGAGLGVEIVRLAAALVDEVGGEVEVAAVAGEAVELDEGELDLLVAVVAALLAGSGPKVARTWAT